MDNLTPEQRRRNMQAIKSTSTKDEVRLAKALWHLGLRYRKNNKKVFGKPDITFKKYKIAIFIDSEFFHGKDWEIQMSRIKSNRDYWIPKIERNIKRDIQVNTYLKEQKWLVLRFWSKQIKQELDVCICKIQHAIAIKKFEHEIYRNSK